MRMLFSIPLLKIYKIARQAFPEGAFKLFLWKATHLLVVTSLPALLRSLRREQ